MDNNERIKKEFEQAEVPERISPENIEKMLAKKAPSKKRKNISMVSRIVAGAAACAVITGGAAYYAGHSGELSRNNGSSGSTKAKDTSSNAIAEVSGGSNTSATYLDGADDYSQIYSMLGEAAVKARKNNVGGDMQFTGAKNEASGVDNADYPAESDEEGGTGGMGGDGSGDHSDTYNQEEGVLEADKCKTDGEYIYYLCTESYNSKNELNIAKVEDGSFMASNVLDIDSAIAPDVDDDWSFYSYVTDMYIYNDMLVITGNTYSYRTNYDYYDDEDYYPYYWDTSQSFAAFFTTGSEPQLIDIYRQDGTYNDVRISAEGYLYMISNYTSCNFEQISDADEMEKYIPSAGMSDSVGFIPAQSILLPDEGFVDCYRLNYAVIGSVDLNASGAPKYTDSKALAGYSGQIYCSANNIYTAAGWDETKLTRIAISGGIITPKASGTVKGGVNDQFSMSEYNGYFRIATTYSEYEETFHKYSDEPWFEEDDYEYYEPDEGYYSYDLIKRDNRVYVLDMDLNIVGSITDFGLDETVQSVNFSGDYAYIVTFRQTDPLFAIDLSDPTSPTILSELHMNGYSTYMQKWSDGLLLGFGIDADDDGFSTGLKLAMYDNSDPDDLKEAGIYSIARDEDGWLWSEATWNRKALLIMPEKNLIAVPVQSERKINENYDYEYASSVMVFSYSDGEFSLVGEISKNFEDYWYWDSSYDRTVYIDGYVYALSATDFTAARVSDLSITDNLHFEKEHYDDIYYVD